MKRRPATRRSSPALRPRAAVAAVALAFLSACANWPAPDGAADSGKMLQNSLPIAAAALSAGQVDVAQRLYVSLAEHYDDAPEPLLGLGYIAFRNQDFIAAEKHFLQAAERAPETPVILAEALMGAGRAALVQGRSRAATGHFRRALEPGRDTPFAAWIANGLAVAAALDADYDAAGEHYATALRLSSGHPRIAANFVRLLVAAGRIDDAARTYAEHPPSYWTDDDGPELSRLVDEAQREQRLQALARPAAVTTGAPDVPPAPSATETKQNGRDARPLRPPVAAPAKPAPESTKDPDRTPAFRLFDGSMALRLYVPGPSPGDPAEDALTDDERLVSVDTSGLMFRLVGLPGPWTPMQGTSAMAPLSAAPDSAVAGDSSPPATAAHAEAAALPAQSPGSVEPGGPESPSSLQGAESAATQPGSPASLAESDALQARAPASESGAAQSESGMPVAESTAPQSDFPADSLAESPAQRPARTGAEPTLAPARPASPATPEAARAHPLPESEILTGTGLDASPPTTLSVPVGQSRRIHLEHPATTVLVASPEVADVQLLAPNVLYVIGRTVGRTSVAVLDDNNLIEEQVVAVVLDLEPLRTILAGEPDLFEVRANRLSRGIALTGDVASAAAADRALRLAAGALPEGVPIDNQLQVAAPQQVNLEVQIAEVNRLVTEELGINWEAFGISGTEQFGFRVGSLPRPRIPQLDRGLLPPASFDNEPASSILLSSVGPWRGQFQAMINALATAGLANVLARPNVTAISGESAAFFSGGEFPLPSGVKDGVIVFSYKKYGVLLDFVPTVVDSGRIVLTVRPEVSEPSQSGAIEVAPGISVPVMNVRRAETTVEVGNGESIVIAGLFRNRSNTVSAGLPVLKDIPALGVLFGRTSTESEELELIVIVTARLVEPNAAPEDTGAPQATLRANGYHY